VQRVMTLNVRHGGGDSVALIAPTIARWSPDTIVITEYRNGELVNAFGLASQLPVGNIRSLPRHLNGTTASLLLGDNQLTSMIDHCLSQIGSEIGTSWSALSYAPS